MAEKDPLQKLEEQLKCAICLDTYTNPKVLLCNHVYCQQCLELLGARNRQEVHTLTCPNCRKATPIPEGGVKDLLPAFQINNLLEIQVSLKKRGMVVGLSTSPSHSKVASFCPDHDDEELKLHCETCNKLVCFNCVIKGAKHHTCDYVMLNKLNVRYRTEVVAALEPVKKNLAAIEVALQQLNVRYGEVSDQQVSAEASIKTIIKELHNALETRQTELISQLHQDTDEKLECLGTQIDEVEGLRTHLRQCEASVEEKLGTSSEEEVVTTKAVLIGKIAQANSLFKSDLLTPNTEADIKFIASAAALGVCHNYGALSTGELLPDPAQCYATGPGLEAALVGEEATVIVHGVNNSGDPCEVPVQSLQSELVSEINDSIWLVSDIGSSGKELVLKYTPAIKGRHHLRIRIKDQHIKGSPFTVRVKSQEFAQISTINIEKPWGITVNHENEIIVSEPEKHCVSVFRPSGEKLRSFGTLGSKEGHFNHPCGVTVDDQGNILVTDYRNHRIQKFTPDGRFLAAVGTKGTGTLQFKGPKAIAFNSFNRRLYVVDENNRVQVTNLDLSFSNLFGGHGSGFGQLSEPWGIECDRFGRVFVPVRGQSRIQVFSADGTFLRIFGKFGFLSFPFGIAIDSEDRLFLSDRHKDCISVFSLEGESLFSFCSRGRGPGQLNHPRGIVVGDCDVLYVCDDDNDRISIF